MLTTQLKVTGLVQGVGFRYYSTLIAKALGLKGTVKNEPDGSVTIQIQGSPAQCEKYRRKLLKIQSFTRAQIDQIEIMGQEDLPAFEDFKIIS